LPVIGIENSCLVLLVVVRNLVRISCMLHRYTPLVPVERNILDALHQQLSNISMI